MDVLLVEDTPEQAQIVEAYIDMVLPSARVVHAACLTDAKTCLKEDHFDAVLLDLGLPDGEGVQSVTELHQVDAETPLIVLTSAGEEGLGILCLQAGAHDFLEKVSVTPQAIEKALSFASTRKSEEVNLFLQREIDSVNQINRNPTREFEASVRLAYQAYLVKIDPSLEAATEIIKTLRKQGVKFSELLSLHSLALEELARRLPPEKLRHVAGKSCYLALAVTTVLNHLLMKKTRKKT